MFIVVNEEILFNQKCLRSVRDKLSGEKSLMLKKLNKEVLVISLMLFSDLSDNHWTECDAINTASIRSVSKLRVTLVATG